MYFVRTPYLAQIVYPQIVWVLPNSANTIYLTFDDGPDPEITPWVLEQLRKYNFNATFFCLGEQAEKYPEVVRAILQNGHAVGNHGYQHLNGWKTRNEDYFQNTQKGKEILESVTGQSIILFRPPYGRIKKSQLSGLEDFIINWSLMPGDFDTAVSKEKCCNNFLKEIQSGDIVCLHDSQQAKEHLHYSLPLWLDYIHNKGLKSDSLTLQHVTG